MSEDILLIVDEHSVVIVGGDAEIDVSKNVDRDPVRPLDVEGHAMVKLSEQSAMQLAQKLLNATGENPVWFLQSVRREDDGA